MALSREERQSIARAVAEQVESAERRIEALEKRELKFRPEFLKVLGERILKVIDSRIAPLAEQALIQGELNAAFVELRKLDRAALERQGKALLLLNQNAGRGAGKIGGGKGAGAAGLEERIKALEATALRYAGVWKSGARYLRGELVTHGGSLWLVREAMVEDLKPGTSGAYQLICKGRS